MAEQSEAIARDRYDNEANLQGGEEPPSSGSLHIRERLWSETRTLGHNAWTALKLLVVLLILCGVVFPSIVLIVGQLAFPYQANGSLVRDKQGNPIGSSLLGQQFTRVEYFHGRPSVVGYDASNSSGSNIGPTNPQLINGNGSEVTVAPGTPPPANATPVPGKANTYYVPGSYLGVKTYAEQFRKENGLSPDTPLPTDIITASGSGLDPDISVDAALLQVDRIVEARRAFGGKNGAINPGEVKELVTQNTQGRDFDILGEPSVNVLALNMALDATYSPPPAR